MIRLQLGRLVSQRVGTGVFRRWRGRFSAPYLLALFGGLAGRPCRDRIPELPLYWSHCFGGSPADMFSCPDWHSRALMKRCLGSQKACRVGATTHADMGQIFLIERVIDPASADFTVKMWRMQWACFFVVPGSSIHATILSGWFVPCAVSGNRGGRSDKR